MSEQDCKDCNQYNLSPECDGHAIRKGEICPYKNSAIEQAQAGRLMTFEEFAPQCIVVADRWIENHPQDPEKDWSDTYALARTLRDCIQRGIDQLQRETEPDERAIALPCKASTFKDEIENRFRSECPISDTDLEDFGDCKKNCFDCFTSAIAARELAAREPKGEATT